MQYKQNQKIIIDKRKLDILIRVGCPDELILQTIKTGTFAKTGDSLIDDTLECLIDVRDFENWGGTRKGAGRKSKNQDENHLENQVDNHLVNQDANQDTFQLDDKDIDIDIEENNSIKERGIRGKPLKEEEILFDEFWKLYTPVKCKDGSMTGKGSKTEALKSFHKALNVDSYENIKKGLLKYLNQSANNYERTAHVSTFLNKQYWKIEDEDVNVDSETEETSDYIDADKLYEEWFGNNKGEQK